jgi:3-deoxy-D-manno-octulosonate 8-phosphate phosphatase (KDO 8-P phosphatase)
MAVTVARDEQLTVQERAERLRLLLFDVDGVLTDGVVTIHADGSESKGFHIKDGAAIVWAQRAGLAVGLLSARTSGATTHRAAQLAVRIVHQGVSSKRAAFEHILRESETDEQHVGYMGDDLLDLPVLERVGLSAAPSDAAAEVRQAVHWVSSARGGRGAVREFIELVLRAQRRWDAVLADYVSKG